MRFLFIRFCILFTLWGYSSFASASIQKIQFQKGKSEVTIKDKVQGYEFKEYSIQAKAGQKMTLQVQSSNFDLHLVMFSVNGKPTDNVEDDEWSEVLQETGEYRVRVMMNRNGARKKGSHAAYTLHVRIE